MPCHFIEVGLGLAGQVGFLREVLSQQSIRVFVGAALPGTLRITEVTLTLVATVKLLWLANSNPRSHVNDRRSDAGSLRTWRLSAATTVAVSLLGTLTRMTKRECRSTRVAM